MTTTGKMELMAPAGPMGSPLMKGTSGGTGQRGRFCVFWCGAIEHESKSFY